MKNWITFLLAFVLISCQLNKPKTQSEEGVTGYQIGDIADDFSLMNVDSNMVSLASLGEETKGYIIVFTCNHCPFSVAYEDRIIALDNKYKPLGYPVVAINPNDPGVEPEDSFDKMQIRAKEKAFPFPYLFDEGQQVFPKYGATKTPHVFVLQKTEEGNRVEYIGTIDNSYKDAEKAKQKFVEMAVDALLLGKSPNPSMTKAIGCSIKVKS